jgi:hypothetical protein
MFCVIMTSYSDKRRECTQCDVFFTLCSEKRSVHKFKELSSKVFSNSIKWFKIASCCLIMTRLDTIILKEMQAVFAQNFYRMISIAWEYRNEHLSIDRNLFSVHEEITSIRLYTPCNPCSSGYARVFTTWLRLFRMNRTNNFDQSL